MRIGAASRVTVTLVAFLGVAGTRAAQEPAPEKPRPIGLVETATTRLAQIDVSVSGPDGEIASLTGRDFTVKVNLHKIESFVLDLACPSAAPRTDAEAAPTAKPRRTSYVLYFDMPHLTLAGRQRAIDTARALLPGLMAGGHRAMIVSNARAVETVSSFDSDVGALLRALDRLESDRKQWDQYATLETSRMAEVIAATEGRNGSVARGLGVARRHYHEDRFRGERDLRRLAMSLGQLADVDPPKAILYFADTMRDDPGRIYLDMFSTQTLTEDHLLPPETHPLDRVIQEAAAHGIRFYSIQAEGLVAPSEASGRSIGGMSAPQASRTPAMVGVRSAQSALSTLAAETGGSAFLNGVPEAKIVEKVRADLSCMALISFDPGDLPQNTPISVKVETSRPGVTLRTRGQMVLQSEDARRTSKLLAAFLSPDAGRNDMPIRSSLIPAGYVDGAFAAVVQVAVAGAPTPGATWDLGASVVSRERVREEGSGRLTVSAAATPVFFETTLKFSPGPYEIVSVAHDATTGQIASRRDEGIWPDPDAEEATVGPIAVLQPATGAYIRDGKPASSGTRAQSDQDPVRADLPTAILGIVCRGKRASGPIRLERRLEGETAVEFPSMDVDMGADRCVQVRDLVPAGSMTSGHFRYEIAMSRGGVEVARGAREFRAVEPAQAAK